MSSQIFKCYASIILFGAIAILSGCMTIPDAIKGGAVEPTQNLMQVKATPNAYIGKQVRLGGR